MATSTESKVLCILADELEKTPVRGIQPAGLRDRRTIVKVVTALREMASHGTFESGRYKSLDDIEEILRFYRVKRARKGKLGRPRLPEVEPEPGYVRETLARTKVERENFEKPGKNERPKSRYAERNRKINAALKAKRRMDEATR